MSIYTNEGLVKHVKTALALKTKYMWGGIFREITAGYISQLRKMYGNKSGTGYSDARWNTLQSLIGKGYYGVDCVGLVKSYYWSGKPEGGTGSSKYSSISDVNAGSMYDLATVKGSIDTLPECPGLIVISRKHGNHVGVYIGNGETIESTLGSRGDGVVKHKLDKTFWTDWFQCPFIEYKQTVDTPKTSLRNVTLAYNATIRRTSKYKSESLGVLTAGTQCVIVSGTETQDPQSKYTYVKLYGRAGWIVVSAIK